VRCVSKHGCLSRSHATRRGAGPHRLNPIRATPPDRLPERPAYLSPTESARQHLNSVDQHDRHSITELLAQVGIVDIDDLQSPPLAFDPPGHDRQRLGADSTNPAGQEPNRLHECRLRPRAGDTKGCGIVERQMRPATVLAIVLLLLTLAIAGVVFVIQLLSVT